MVSSGRRRSFRSGKGAESMRHRIITIGREFGSGGRTSGREVAQRLGIPCYDQEIINKMAEESGFTKEYVENESENASRRSWAGSST